MKKIFTIPMMITTVTLLCCCNNDVDRDMLESDPKLVLYCFPGTDNDTTVIDLSSSIPVNRNVQFDRKESYLIPHATISYRLNGTELPVMYAKESTGRVPVGKYYVVAKHHCGDNISIEASAEGFPAVHAKTTIPEMPEIKGVSSVPTYRDYTSYTQQQVTIADNPATDDYYAVNYYEIYYRKRYSDEEAGAVGCDTIRQLIQRVVNIDDEPALSPGNTLDDFFDYNNSFYQDFYIFNDNTFTSNNYTLRLNTIFRDLETDNDVTRKGYGIKLYKIAPPLYRFVKSINDIRNNKLGEYGLALSSPTLNNVEGGLGCVGGYSVTEYEQTSSFEAMRVNQREYECDQDAHSFDFELLNYDSWLIDAVVNYTYVGEWQLTGRTFDGRWCRAEIPMDNPRILHVEIQPISTTWIEKYTRYYTLQMRSGERTTTITISQTTKGTQQTTDADNDEQ